MTTLILSLLAHRHTMAVELPLWANFGILVGQVTIHDRSVTVFLYQFQRETTVDDKLR